MLGTLERCRRFGPTQPRRASVAGPSGAARPENVWAPEQAAREAQPLASTGHERRRLAPELLTMRRAVMLVGGVLTLVAVRRRRRLREAPPRARLPRTDATRRVVERELRNVVAGERVARVDLAAREQPRCRSSTSGQRLLVAIAATDGTIEIVASGPAALPAMWQGARRSLDAAGICSARGDRRRCQAGERPLPGARAAGRRRQRARRLRRSRGDRRIGDRRAHHPSATRSSPRSRPRSPAPCWPR